MEPLSQCLRLALHTQQSTVRAWLKAEEKPLVLLLFSSDFFLLSQKSSRSDHELRSTVSRRQRRLCTECHKSLNFFIVLASSGLTCGCSTSGLPHHHHHQKQQYLRCIAVPNLPFPLTRLATRRESDSHIFYCVFTNHFDWFSGGGAEWLNSGNLWPFDPWSTSTPELSELHLDLSHSDRKASVLAPRAALLCIFINSTWTYIMESSNYNPYYI